MALQWLLGSLSDRIGRRSVLIAGALPLTRPRGNAIDDLTTQFRRPFWQNQYRFIAQRTAGRHGTGGLRSTKAIVDGDYTSIVLVVPVIGPPPAPPR